MAYCACRMCGGNGLVTLPDRPNLVWKTYRCSHCNATGCDVEATKKSKTILNHEKNYPSPLPNSNNLTHYP